MNIFFTLILFSLSITIPVQAEMYNVVGTELPPLMYTENGKAEGFYVDLLHAMIFNLKDADIKVKFYPAKRMFKVLSETDNTFSLGITRNENREDLYKWVGPIYPRIFALFKLRKRSDIQVEKLEDVCSYQTGVGRGYAVMNDLLKAGVPKKNIQEVSNDTLNIKKLFHGRIDFVVMNDIMLSYLLKKEGHMWNDVEKVMILNDQYEFWYAFNKNINDRTIQKFQQSFDQLKQDGRYGSIVKKYF